VILDPGPRNAKRWPGKSSRESRIAAPISQRSPDHDGTTWLQAIGAAVPYAKVVTYGLAPDSQAPFSRSANPLMPRATFHTSWRQTARYRTFLALETLFSTEPHVRSVPSLGDEASRQPSSDYPGCRKPLKEHLCLWADSNPAHMAVVFSLVGVGRVSPNITGGIKIAESQIPDFLGAHPRQILHLDHCSDLGSKVR